MLLLLIYCLLLLPLFVLFSALQYILKPLRGFGCCLVSQAIVLLLLIYCLLLLPLFCAVLCLSIYIQASQWLRLLSVLTGDGAVVVDLLFIVAPVVLFHALVLVL